jgi:hypothetical protein
MMRLLVVIAVALALFQSQLCRANAEADIDPKVNLVTELQAAVSADDKAWFVARLHYPVRYFGKQTHVIKSKAWFLDHYQTIIGPELKASILAQDPQKYFQNYQGVMVGEGSRNIWFDDFGEGDGPKFKIITINNSD